MLERARRSPRGCWGHGLARVLSLMTGLDIVETYVQTTPIPQHSQRNGQAHSLERALPQPQALQNAVVRCKMLSYVLADNGARTPRLTRPPIPIVLPRCPYHPDNSNLLEMWDRNQNFRSTTIEPQLTPLRRGEEKNYNPAVHSSFVLGRGNADADSEPNLRTTFIRRRGLPCGQGKKKTTPPGAQGKKRPPSRAVRPSVRAPVPQQPPNWQKGRRRDRWEDGGLNMYASMPK